MNKINAGRRPTNVNLSADLVEEAKALGVNLSRASESGLEAAVKAERGRRWKIENREALQSYNEWFEEHGMLLEGVMYFLEG